MKHNIKCLTRSDLFIQYARLLNMIAEHGNADLPANYGIKLNGVILSYISVKSPPNFNEPSTHYEFALGIVEGKFVFRGDVLYSLHPDSKGELRTVKSVYSGDEESFTYEECNYRYPCYKNVTWQPPVTYKNGEPVMVITGNDEKFIPRFYHSEGNYYAWCTTPWTDDVQPNTDIRKYKAIRKLTSEEMREYIEKNESWHN
jgi:hypothetical protein